MTKFLLKTLIVVGLMGINTVHANTNKTQACPKVSKYVKEQLGLSCSSLHSFSKIAKGANNSATSIFVVLMEQADLSMQNMYADPLARRTYIVNALKEVAERSQAPLRAILTAKGIKHTPYYIHNMIRIDEATGETVKELAIREDIKNIFGNPSFKVSRLNLNRAPVFADLGAVGVENNIVSTGADKVWNELNVKGKGVVVAGQDTGVQWDHPALMRKYRGYHVKPTTPPVTPPDDGQDFRNLFDRLKAGIFPAKADDQPEIDHNYNWYDAIKESVAGGENNKCGFNTQAPCDDDQHGTHTMGTVVGSDESGENQIGMAPEANWMACRNMDAGAGAPGTYLDCFQFFLAPFPLNGDAFKDGDPSKSPNVMNNSWGCPAEEGCKGTEFAEALHHLREAGIFVVASAGNDGPGCFTIDDQPAQVSEDTFSVGAHNHRNGEIADFSSRGPSKLDKKIGPDVTAPGVGIRSSIPGGEYQGGFWSGTSMAGPHVVGAVALVWSANPDLIGKVDETTELLRQTATPTTIAEEACGGIAGTAVPNNTFGFGRLDAYAAVKKALEMKNNK